MASAVTTPAVQVVPSGHHAAASLYVGDLHLNVTETQLFDKFSQIGPVLSIRVCRDAVTRRSLGYAYVNFQQPEHAKRALEEMNFDMVNNRSIRIMWSNRDPTERRSGAGNIFIKNLDKSIDHKGLHDTFLLFGNILSCKVAMDDEGVSKGYGFVHFEAVEAAALAIEKVNGMLIAEKLVYVAPFKSRAARLKEMGETPASFKNVFIKNFGVLLDTDDLRNLFSKFGEIDSCVAMKDSDGKLKGFGFVSFKKSEDAAKAVEEMNGFLVEDGEPDQKLTVCRAQKKSERAAALKERYELFKIEQIKRYQGLNLYVKNLDDSVDEAALEKLFSPYGKITSVKVMRDEVGRSKGFGFVCFEKPEEATMAHKELQGKMLTKKPLYVAMAMRKEDRKAYLASQYMQRLANSRLSQGITANAMFTPASGAFFVNAMQTPQRTPYLAGTTMPMPGVLGHWSGQPMQHQGQPYNQFMMGPRQGRFAQRRGGGMQPRQPYNIGGPSYSPVNPHQRQNIESMPVNPTELSRATPEEQKQMLGQQIFSKITQICHPSERKHVSKLAGMMLEMETTEILHCLGDDELFKHHYNQAANALANSQR